MTKTSIRPSTVTSQAFRTLKKYATQHNITLKKDRHCVNSTVFLDKRKSWLSLSIFSLGLLLGPQTDIYASDDKPHNNEYSINTLGIIAPNKQQSINSEPAYPNKKFTSPTSSSLKMSNPQLTQQIDEILTSHLDTRDIPDYVAHDLKLMAKYYSQFPEAVSLLKSIAAKPWTLQFKKNTWETQVIGTIFSVNSAKIIFDTRAAAKLKLRPQCDNNPRCISSPADVLLHELLHAQAIFLDSNRFLKNGGMNPHFYPTLHEMDIIKSEKQLYKQMEERDGLKRPQRVKHVGKIKPTSCVTCIM